MVIEHLERASGHLRFEIAAAVTRKRAPLLLYRLAEPASRFLNHDQARVQPPPGDRLSLARDPGPRPRCHRTRAARRGSGLPLGSSKAMLISRFITIWIGRSPGQAARDDRYS